MKVYSIIKMDKEIETQEIQSRVSLCTLHSKKIHWTIFFVILIPIVASETSWRHSLFDANNNIIPGFQQRSSVSTIDFFKVMTVFGQEQLMIPITLLILLVFPIQNSFSLLICILYSTLWTNLLKGVYGQERPFWVNKDILNYSCEGGFGNPSGHSYSSAAFYISLCFILTQKTKLRSLNKVLTVMLFIFFSLLIITIFISRLLLGVHSINQVLYGGLLGLLTFYLVFFCFSFHRMNSIEFSKYFTEVFIVSIFFIKYLFMFLGLLLIYLLVDFDTSEYDKVLRQVCPDDWLKPTFKYNNNNFNSGITFFALIGAHAGLSILNYVVKYKPNWFPARYDEDDIANFNKISCYKWLLQIPIFVIVVGPIFALFAISSHSNVIILFLFKGILPFTLIGLNAFGLAPFLILKYVYVKPAVAETEKNNSKDFKAKSENDLGEGIEVKRLNEQPKNSKMDEELIIIPFENDLEVKADQMNS